MPAHQNQPSPSQDIEITGQVFKYVDSKTVDEKYRVTLGSKIAKFLRKLSSPRSMDIFLSSEGYILLRPMAHIPASEAWIWQDEELHASFDRALTEARAGKTTPVDDLDDFLENL
ncbi:MAG: hypothetical protein V3W14_07075 [Candidatus Neomarinimicrobiota bacterium]